MQDFLTQLKTNFRDFLFKEGTAPITGISTDSRTLLPGDLFFALSGENFDAHDFLPHVLHESAGIVCSKLPDVPFPPHLTIFLVPNTLSFYQELAKQYLQTKPHLIRIAITGSSGKTSTKEWLAQLLQTQYKTYKNTGNFNNLIGVPKSALDVRDEQMAIFEMGSGKPGDIAQLRDIVDPDWVIVTGVGEAHLEFFASLEKIAEEKASLCTVGKQCYTIEHIPFRETHFHNFQKISPQTLFSSILSKQQEGFLLTLENHSFLFPFFGEYNLSNFSLATAVALALGIHSDNIARVSFTPLPSYRSYSVVKNQSLLILDCYNANPLSMVASLTAVWEFSPKPLLILGDMLELGKDALTLHQCLGEFLNEHPFSLVFFVGPLMHEAAKIYKHSHHWVEKLSDFKSLLPPFFEQKHTFFVKGSRGMHLEDIAEW